MNRLPLITTVVFFASIGLNVRPASAALTSGASPPKCYLEIGGVACGTVQKAAGGDLRATVVEGSDLSKYSGALKKQPARPPAFAPLVITVGFPLAQPIADWIGDVCANRETRKTVRLVETDATGTVRLGTDWYDTELVEVDFPALDASDKSDALLTLTFMPVSSLPVATGGKFDTSKYSAATRINISVPCANFALAVDGLETSSVNRIEALTIKRSPTALAGDVRSTGTGLPSSATTEYSNLVVSVSESHATTWHAWFDDFIVKGNSFDTQEKGGTLTLLDSTRSQTAFTLQFFNLGILRITPPAFDASTEEIVRDQAELYCEMMIFTAGGSAAGTSTSGSSAATGATSTTPAGTATTPGSLTAPPPIKGTAPVGTTPLTPGVAPAGSSPSTTAGASGTPSLSTPIPGTAMAVSPVSTSAGSSPTLTTLPTSPAAASAISPVPGLPTALPSMPSVPGISPAVAPLPISPPAPIAPGATPAFSPAAPMAPTLAPVAFASAAADQTSAALANFPVFSGAVRTSFSSSRGKASWQERANYTVAVAPDSAVSSYAPQLAAAGWSETSRAQSGDAAAKTLQFTLDLQKDQTRGHVVLAQNAKGGTNIAAVVTTLFPGNSAPALSAGASAAPASGATTSAADRGARDPADFPRLPGSIRASFTSTSQTTSTMDVATYTAKCSPGAADAFYAQSLPGSCTRRSTRSWASARASTTCSSKMRRSRRRSRFATSSARGGAAARGRTTTRASTLRRRASGRRARPC